MNRRLIRALTLLIPATLVVGLAADLAVFALDEIELRTERRVADVPGGSWRFTRPPAGFRATIVNGAPTVDAAGPTGARPGVVCTPSEHHA